MNIDQFRTIYGDKKRFYKVLIKKTAGTIMQDVQASVMTFYDGSHTYIVIDKEVTNPDYEEIV